MTRIELLSEEFANLNWIGEGASDYYFLIEIGEQAGNFLRVEGTIIIGKGTTQKSKKGYLLLFEDP